MDAKMEVVSAGGAATLPLAGKSVVVTGTLLTMKRDEVERMTLKAGWKAAGSVSKKTSFVVAGPTRGASWRRRRNWGWRWLTRRNS